LYLAEYTEFIDNTEFINNSYNTCINNFDFINEPLSNTFLDLFNKNKSNNTYDKYTIKLSIHYCYKFNLMNSVSSNSNILPSLVYKSKCIDEYKYKIYNEYNEYLLKYKQKIINDYNKEVVDILEDIKRFLD
jgi:hypothetical protein